MPPQLGWAPGRIVKDMLGALSLDDVTGEEIRETRRVGETPEQIAPPRFLARPPPDLDEPLYPALYLAGQRTVEHMLRILHSEHVTDRRPNRAERPAVRC